MHKMTAVEENVGDNSIITPDIMMTAPNHINLLNEARSITTDKVNVNGITNCDKVDCAIPLTCGFEKIIRIPFIPFNTPMTAKAFLYSKDCAAFNICPYFCINATPMKKIGTNAKETASRMK